MLKSHLEQPGRRCIVGASMRLWGWNIEAEAATLARVAMECRRFMR